ncbi:MAG: YkgJ family cysteine cluster protein [Planctomycetes bacterium]|nr:YkgJ family cysteine cluster protein [Planctomycetota bacterium]
MVDEAGAERRAGFPFRFRCQRSGNCCAVPGGVVRVTGDEVQAIAGFLGLAAGGFARRYLQPDGVRLVDGFGNRCVFLVDGVQASCAIYPVRPAKCRQWPFWPEVLGDPELFLRVVRTCPGIEVEGG